MNIKIMIFLLISGGALVVIGAVAGAILVKMGLKLGNKLTLSGKSEVPIDEEIIPIDQERTE